MNTGQTIVQFSMVQKRWPPFCLVFQWSRPLEKKPLVSLDHLIFKQNMFFMENGPGYPNIWFTYWKTEQNGSHFVNHWKTEQTFQIPNVFEKSDRIICPCLVSIIEFSMKYFTRRSTGAIIKLRFYYFVFRCHSYF